MALRPYRARGTHRASFLSGSALFALLNVVGAASAQTQLPEVVVSAPKEQPKPKPRTAQVHAAQPAAPETPAAQLNAKADAFDQGRSNLYTTIGTTSDTMSHATIEALPGKYQYAGRETPVAVPGRLTGFCGQRRPARPQ